MHSILGFLGTVILLLTMVNHAHADTVREDAEGLRTEVVLEASEIDSRTVEVGALAVVVYGKGERRPTSGSGLRWIRRGATLKPSLRRV